MAQVRSGAGGPPNFAGPEKRCLALMKALNLIRRLALFRFFAE